jgi:hypothetical protein
VVQALAGAGAVPCLQAARAGSPKNFHDEETQNWSDFIVD